MKIRIGYGLGIRTSSDAGRFAALVDGLEGLRFDSLWLSERLTGDTPDPMIGLAVAAGRTSKLKLGTSVQVLPGRNPVEVAKQWATLDQLSNGRALPAFGLGVADPREQQAFGVERSERARLFDQALPLIRRLWSEDEVDGIRVRPHPVQQPLDVWLGGIAPSELRRIGRLADGWLPSFVTPQDVERARPIVEAEAAAHGRAIDSEHWGALIPYLPGRVRGDGASGGGGGELPEIVIEGLKARRPDIDPAALVASGHDGLRKAIEAFVDVGFSKFVAIPIAEPKEWDGELSGLAEAVLDLQA